MKVAITSEDCISIALNDEEKACIKQAISLLERIDEERGNCYCDFISNYNICYYSSDDIISAINILDELF